MIFGLFGKKQQDLVSFPRNLKAEAALKQASAFKKAGNLDKAIDALRTFRRHAETGKVSFGVESYLRLPLYLQAAGQRDEAWSEFYRLLEDGCPNQINFEGCRWMERSTVYDKMRLFLQRDSQPRLAFYFDALSLAASLRGRRLLAEPDGANLDDVRATLGEMEYRDALKAEMKRSTRELSALKACMSAPVLADQLTPRAKKADCLNLLPSLVSLFSELKTTDFDFEVFSNKAKTLLLDPEE